MTADHTQPPSGTGRTAGFHLGTDDGAAYWWGGALSLVKVSSDDSQGGLSIVDHRVPAGYAPPAHTHEAEDEVFFVLDGTFEMTCGDDVFRAEPGSLVFLPRGVRHAYAVSDDGPARALLILTPGGFDGFVREMGASAVRLTLPGPDGPVLDPAEAARISAAHGQVLSPD